MDQRRTGSPRPRHSNELVLLSKSGKCVGSPSVPIGTPIRVGFPRAFRSVSPGALWARFCAILHPGSDRFTRKNRSSWRPCGTSEAVFLVTRAVGPPGCASRPWRRRGASPFLFPLLLPKEAERGNPHGRLQFLLMTDRKLSPTIGVMIESLA